MAVLADRETRTHWDHVTGEALDGPLQGSQLEVWPVRMTTVAAARIEHADIPVFPSTHHGFQWRLAQKLYPDFIHSRGLIPGFFHLSMDKPADLRLDKLIQGLGVMVGSRAKYYPLNRIPRQGLRDQWLGKSLVIERGGIDGVPHATWEETGTEPMQMLTRWYGFSYTYPECDIYEPASQT